MWQVSSCKLFDAVGIMTWWLTSHHIPDYFRTLFTCCTRYVHRSGRGQHYALVGHKEQLTLKWSLNKYVIWSLLLTPVLIGRPSLHPVSILNLLVPKIIEFIRSAVLSYNFHSYLNYAFLSQLQFTFKHFSSLTHFIIQITRFRVYYVNPIGFKPEI